MKHRVLLSLLLALGCAHVRGAPVEQAGLEQGSCDDASAKAAAGLALTKINQDRKEGYVFSLHRLSNVHTAKNGDNGVVFYLTLDVVETNCSVLNRGDKKTCEARPTHDTPVYGQCKTAIYISRVNRVVRLYKYDCVIRPVPSARLVELCPDCPTLIGHDDVEVQKTVAASLEKFNKESGLAKRFALLNVTRATASMGMSTFYNVEYTVQETTCANGAKEATAEKCPLLDCEFTHKGFCKASHVHPPVGDAMTDVECDIYEPEAADREKKLHLKAEETDHSHNDTHTHAAAAAADDKHDHAHDHAHAADGAHTHDHANDHTKGHVHGPHTHTHDNDADAEHHHSHDHDAGSAHRHAHDHTHDHGHGHDHVHAHHAKAHNHSDDAPNHHHGYKHADGSHTHEHDHELALDHDHKHPHLHQHEHHHHHHDHEHEKEYHDHPEGKVTMLPTVDQPTTLPFFPEVPEVAVTLPAKLDPEIPGEMEPTIRAFPTSVSAQCTAAPVVEPTLVDKLFAEDPRFKGTA
ncbi:fetuin B [Scophthalmus maximus]|uniref:fetuin B n=1 Tax=Scophthalmus maximus TaxID=52904 RepID=UPI001FA8BC33|nr:fetuin B [Scophthalmus maximus]